MQIYFLLSEVTPSEFEGVNVIQWPLFNFAVASSEQCKR